MRAYRRAATVADKRRVKKQEEHRAKNRLCRSCLHPEGDHDTDGCSYRTYGGYNGCSCRSDADYDYSVCRCRAFNPPKKSRKK